MRARRLTRTSASWATLPLRIGLGSAMFAHGAQKVLGLWGGRGLDAWLSGMTPFKFMQPAWIWLGAAALAEFLGGILILIGFLTRPAAFLIACTMLTAVVGFHWRNGFFLAEGGFEYAGVLLGIAISLLISGGGNGSVDQRLG